MTQHSKRGSCLSLLRSWRLEPSPCTNTATWPKIVATSSRLRPKVMRRESGKFWFGVRCRQTSPTSTGSRRSTMQQGRECLRPRWTNACSRAWWGCGKPQSAGVLLCCVACRRGHAAVIRLLLEAGANPDSNQCGATALVRAAFAGHTAVCRLLLSAGADPDIADVSFGDGRTALHKAAAEGHTSVCSALLDQGADARLVDAKGQRAHDLATGPLAATLLDAYASALQSKGPAPDAFKVPDLHGPPPPRPSEDKAAGGAPAPASKGSQPTLARAAPEKRSAADPGAGLLSELSLLGLPRRRRVTQPAGTVASAASVAAPASDAIAATAAPVGPLGEAARPSGVASAAPAAPWARVDPHLSALCNTEYAEQPWTSPAATSAEALASRARQHRVAGAAVSAGAIGSQCAACNEDSVVLAPRPCCSALVCPACDRNIARRRRACVCAAGGV